MPINFGDDFHICGKEIFDSSDNFLHFILDKIEFFILQLLVEREAIGDEHESCFERRCKGRGDLFDSGGLINELEIVVAGIFDSFVFNLSRTHFRIL